MPFDKEISKLAFSISKHLDSVFKKDKTTRQNMNRMFQWSRANESFTHGNLKTVRSKNLEESSLRFYSMPAYLVCIAIW